MDRKAQGFGTRHMICHVLKGENRALLIFWENSRMMNYELSTQECDEKYCKTLNFRKHLTFSQIHEGVAQRGGGMKGEL